MNYYPAPWGKHLVITSLLVTVLCLAVIVGLLLYAGVVGWIAAPLVAAIMIGCALFIIRGYTVVPDALLVHRLLWKTRVSLAGLESAEAAPDAMRGSWRTMGNGGFYSFTGFFWSSELGRYRALVTDFASTVVLRYPDQTIVISPSAPDQFVRDVERRIAVTPMPQ